MDMCLAIVRLRRLLVRDRRAEWQAARAPDRRYRVGCIVQACPSRPLAICGLLFFEGLTSEDAQPGADVEVPLDAEELEAFPQGITVEGATPKTRGGKVARGLATFPPARGAPAAKKPGSLPPLPPPPVRRHDAPCEAGRRRTALCRRGFGESLPTRFQCGFPAQPGPQRRELRPLREERWSGQDRAPPSEPPR